MQMSEEDPRSLVRQQKIPISTRPSPIHPSALHTGVPPGDVPQSIRRLGGYLPVAAVATPTLHLPPLTRHGKGGGHQTECLYLSSCLVVVMRAVGLGGGVPGGLEGDVTALR